MSALGADEQLEDLGPVLPGQVGDGAGGRGVRVSTCHLPAELRLRPGRRRALAVRHDRPLLPVIAVVGPGTQRIQPIWVEDVGDVLDAWAGLPPEAANRLRGRRARTSSPGTSSGSGSRATLGKRRPLVHVPFGLAKAPAHRLRAVPEPPVTRDQIEMLDLGDNVCDPRPAVDTFGIDLLPLDEQIRRAIGS